MSDSTRNGKQQREKLFQKQDGLCHYCNCRMTMELDRENTCTRDHIITVKDGGKNGLDNLVGACFRCNVRRGNTPYEDYKVVAKYFGHNAKHPTLADALLDAGLAPHNLYRPRTGTP